jgi:hypothetical protein
MKKRNYTLIISVISIIIGIAAICLVLFRIEPVTADWLGIWIGVLSMLVVLLLGWNILSVVDIRNITSKIEYQNSILHSNYEKHTSALSCIVYHVLFEFYAERTEEAEPFIRYGLCYMDECLKLEDTDGANSVVKILNECILETTEVSLSNKKNLLLILHRIKNIEKLNGFNTLKDKIVNLVVNKQTVN